MNDLDNDAKNSFTSLVDACCRRDSTPTYSASSSKLFKKVAVKRERPHRQPIAPMCDDTAFANDVDVRIQGVGLELNDDNKKRVRNIIRAYNGRNDYDSAAANIDKAVRSVPEPPQPKIRTSELKLSRRKMDLSLPNADTVRRHYSIPQPSSRPAPSYINFVKSEDG